MVDLGLVVLVNIMDWYCKMKWIGVSGDEICVFEVMVDFVEDWWN